MKGPVPPAELLRRWTRKEYDRLIELGAFRNGERLELVNATSEPEPDVSVVPGDARTYRDEHPSRPRLVVEVTDSSSRIDHEFKASLYARATVPECWIVDLRRGAVEVHRSPAESTTAPYGWRYADVKALRPPATIAPLLAPTTTIAVADLLP